MHTRITHTHCVRCAELALLIRRVVQLWNTLGKTAKPTDFAAAFAAGAVKPQQEAEMLLHDCRIPCNMFNLIFNF